MSVWQYNPIGLVVARIVNDVKYGSALALLVWVETSHLTEACLTLLILHSVIPER